MLSEENQKALIESIKGKIAEQEQSKEQKKQQESYKVLMSEAEKGLSEKQFEIWFLYCYNKLTQQEIASKLQVNQSYVSRQIGFILKKLISYFEAIQYHNHKKRTPN